MQARQPMPRFGGHPAANSRLVGARSGDAKTQGGSNARESNTSRVPCKRKRVVPTSLASPRTTLVNQAD